MRSHIGIYISVCWQAHLRDPKTTKPNPNPPKPSFFQKTIVQKSPKLKKPGVLTVYQVVTNLPKSRFSAAKKEVFLIKYKLFLPFFARTVYITIQSDRVYRYIPTYR